MRTGIASSLKSEFRNLRAALHSFEKTLQRIVVTNGVRHAVGNGQARRRRFSAKARAFLVLQGRYMGYMRQLTPRQKAHVRRLRETKGVASAIAKAKQLASREH